MSLDAFRMTANDALRALMEYVLSDPLSLAGMPGSQRCREWRDELYARFERGGSAFPYVVFDVVAKRPLALYWADVSPAGVAFVHQFVLPEARRGMTAVLAARAAARACLGDFPRVKALLGLTPSGNRAALAVARRAGFVDVCAVGDCRLLVAVRGVFDEGCERG